MSRFFLTAACGLAMLLLQLFPTTQAQAQTRIINISAKVSGCTSVYKACDIGALHLPPGSTFQLISPVNVKLKAGTYRISHAGSAGRYKGWMYNSDRKWVWNFGIATPMGKGIGRLFYVAIAGGNYTGDYTKPGFGIFSSLAEVNASNGPIYGGRGGPNAALPLLARSGGPTAYTDTLKLPVDATLSFFVLDWDLHDNIGGVSLKLERLGPPAAGK